jgi:hypothetical protein
MRANSHGRVRSHRVSSRVTHIWASRRARPAVHVSHEGCTENGAVVGLLRPEMLGNRKRIAVFTAVPRKQGTLHGRQGTLPLRSLAQTVQPFLARRFHGRPSGFPSLYAHLRADGAGRGPDATRAAERRSQPLGSATYRPGHPVGTGPCSTRVRISNGIRTRVSVTIASEPIDSTCYGAQRLRAETGLEPALRFPDGIGSAWTTAFRGGVA